MGSLTATVKKRLRSSVERRVFRRALPRWVYPTLHRVGPLRRCFDLQAQMGPATARFLEELRHEDVPALTGLRQAETTAGLKLGREPLVVRGAFLAPRLEWDELRSLLSGVRLLNWGGVDDGTFDEWFESDVKLESRPIPQVLADLFDWSAFEFLDGFCPAVWSQVEGNASQLHQDFCSAVELNMIGKKKWYLFPPTQEDAIYAHLLKRRGYRVALVNPESPTSTRDFPAFANSTGHYEVETQPGDFLYVPAGWFHHVRYLERSFSTHFFNLEEETRNSEGSPLFGLSELMILRNGQLICAEAPPIPSGGSGF